MGVEVNERHGSAAESAVFCAVMQWLLLVVTYIVMAVLHRIARAVGAPLEALATLALGTLVLVAYIAGTIAHRYRIPRIVGYLLAGFVAGPAWLRLVRAPELDALSAIASGALALIALALGNELTLDALRGARRAALQRIVTGATAGPFAAVALVVLSVSPWFPLTAHQPFRDALVVALALGIMAALGSPTLTWAVMTDTNARDPRSQITLDVSVAQSLIAVVLVIVVLALAQPLGSGGAVTPGSAGHSLAMLAGSIAAGITLALAATQFLRVIRDHQVWVWLTFAFVVTQAVRLVGLDPVLIGLAAGVTLRNAAPGHSDRVRRELQRCAMPVYVVFFALAGASLRLDALNDVGLLALLLMGLRAVGLWGGLRWAGRQPAVTAAWPEHGWLGLVSQGGLAVTFAAEFRRAFPEWNVSLQALLLAMIGVHEVLGPLCLHWVLGRGGRGGRGGEITEGGPGEHATDAAGSSMLAGGGSSGV
jgi:Kef-type K+ transport system membrane component KefB